MANKEQLKAIRDGILQETKGSMTEISIRMERLNALADKILEEDK